MNPEPIFFDTDCLSAFLWSGSQCLLTKLYPGRIVIPAETLRELRRVHRELFVQRIDQLLETDQVSVADLVEAGDEADLYMKMPRFPDSSHKAVGRGEAMAMCLTYFRHGILASNNLRDTRAYIQELGLSFKTTGRTMADAYEDGLISSDEAEAIWKTMVDEGCWLGADTFSEFREKPYDPSIGL